MNPKNLMREAQKEREDCRHAVYRNWCAVCVKGRCVERQHQVEPLEEEERERTTPMVAFDCGFLTQENAEEMSCVLGVCWRRARSSSGKKSPARNQRRRRSWIIESLLSVENNSGVPPKKSHRRQRQLGKDQSHTGHRCCRACHASRDVPESETASYELNKEIRCSNGERTIPFKSVEGVQRCTQFRSANVVRQFYLNEKGRASWQCRGAG